MITIFFIAYLQASRSPVRAMAAAAIAALVVAVIVV